MGGYPLRLGGVACEAGAVGKAELVGMRMFWEDVDPARWRGYGFIKGQGLCTAGLVLNAYAAWYRYQGLEAMTPTVKNSQTQGPCFDSLHELTH